MRLRWLTEDEFDDVETTKPVDDRDEFQNNICGWCGIDNAQYNWGDRKICDTCVKMKTGM